MNYCLNALIDKGLVKLGNFQSSQHKLKYVYLLTPARIAEKAKLTGRFLQRKVAEYERLKAEIEGLKKSLKAENSDAVPAEAVSDASARLSDKSRSGRS
jgi:EPS-associated MarR family transcriptional regulator